MIQVVLRGMLERRLRSILTAMAIVFGVAMIAGAFITTDAINSAFGKIEQTAYKGVSAAVTTKTAFRSQYTPPKPFGEGLVTRIRGLGGVSAAEGQLEELGQLVVGGKAVNNTFAPTLVISTSGSSRPLFEQVTVDRGRLPTGPGEIALDDHTAAAQGLKLGDAAGVAARLGLQRVRLVGTVRFGGGTSLGGAILILAPLRDVQRWYGMQGQVTSVIVGARSGVSPEALVSQIRPLLPRGLQVRTGQQQASKETSDITSGLNSFLNPMLLSLAGAALLVGAFIIFNTFSITVAQRTHEFALLRALGASRRQLLAVVSSEALLVGSLASVTGLFAGLGFAALLGWLFDAAGFGIPRSGLPLHARTVIVALAAGVLVTLAAALAPALRATRIPPVAALQAASGAHGPTRFARLRAAVALVAGFALIASGLFGVGPAMSRLSTIGAGIVVVFIGMTLSARWFVRPLAALIGLPVARVFHEPGALARENAMRNPVRTANTAAALMVGLGLVVFVSVFAAGLKATVAGSLDRYVKAQYIVTSSQMYPLPAGAGPAIARTAGVAASSPLMMDQIEVNAHSVGATTDMLEGVDAGALLHVYKPDWIHGSSALVAQLGGDRALVERQFVKAHKLRLGQYFTVTTASGGRMRLRAIGEYNDPNLLPGVLVDTATFAAVSTSKDPYAWFVALAPGASRDAVHAALEQAVKPFPPAGVDSLSQYKQLMSDRLNQIVNMLYALLAMCLVIALFGIANALLLSIHERTREFGLLRAVGATRTQVRRIVRYESVITAVIGGVLGIVVGIAFAGLVTIALSDLGLSFSLPVSQLIVFLMLAVIVGVLGAVAPARRSARIDVLQALHQE